MSIIDQIKEMFLPKPDPELIQLEGGKSECAACGLQIKGKKIFKVPTVEKHFCYEHAQEEMEKIREQSFNLVPDKLKDKVKFSRDEGYHLECIACQRRLNVMMLNWNICNYCNKALCKEHLPGHRCTEMETAAREKREAETPRRCEFCGTRIVADTSIKCVTCNKFFCRTHSNASHHNCKGL